MAKSGMGHSTGSFALEVLAHLKSLPKLEYINVDVQSNIPSFRQFIIHELPKIKYVNWEIVTKEERVEAEELQSKGTWYEKSMGFKNVETVAPSTPEAKKEEIDEFDTYSPRSRNLTMSQAKLLEITSTIRQPHPNENRDSLYKLDNLLDALENLDDGLDDIGDVQTEDPLEPKDKWDLLDEFLQDSHANTSPKKSTEMVDIANVHINIPHESPQKTDDWNFLDEFVDESLLQNIVPQDEERDPLDDIINAFELDGPVEIEEERQDERTKRLNLRKAKKQQREEDIYIESLLNQKIRPDTPKKVYHSDDPIISSLDSILAESEGKEVVKPPPDYDKQNQGIEVIQKKKAQNSSTYDLDMVLNDLDLTVKKEKVKQEPQSHVSALSSLSSFVGEMGSDIGVDSLDSILDQVQSNPNAEIVTMQEKYKPTSTRSLKRGPRKEKYNVAPTLNLLDIDRNSIDVDEVLGNGTWGDTYLVAWNVDHESKKSATMKKLTTEASKVSDDEFNEEVKTLMTCKHANLVPVLGSGKDETRYVLREYIQGTPLKEFLLHPPSPIQAPFIINIARQVGEAIQYLHSMKVIHGNLKSTNVIIDKNMKVWVTDYGFLDCKDLVPLEKSTPEWAAPELIKGTSGYDEKIDAYSFGILLFEMFTRHLPFESLQPGIFVNKVLHHGYKPVWSNNDSIPVAFERLIISCWNDNSASRPSFDVITRILNAPIEKLLQYNKRVVANTEPSTPNVHSSSSVTVTPISNPPVESLPTQSQTETVSKPPAPEIKQEEEEEYQLGETVPAEMPQPIPKKSAETGLPIDEERKISAVLSKISDMLNSGDVDTITKALMSLQDIIKDNRRKAFINKKITIVSDILDILTSTDLNTLSNWISNNQASFNMVEQAMATLESVLSDETPDATMKRAVTDICNILKSSNDYLKVLAVRVLYSLGEFGNNQELIRKHGALYTLISDLSRSFDKLTFETLRALSNLLHNEYSKEDFVSAGGLRKIKDIQSSSNRLVVNATNDVLVHFWDDEKAKELMNKDSIKQMYVTMIEADDQEQVRRAMKAISNILIFEPHSFSELDVIKILGSLKSLLKNKNNLEYDEVLALKLVNTFIQDEKNFSAFKEYSSIETIISLLSNTTVNIKMACTRIISKFILDTEARSIFGSLGGVLSIISYLYDTNTQLRMWSFTSIAQIIRDPTGLSHFLDNAGISRMISIITYGRNTGDILAAIKILNDLAKHSKLISDIRFMGGIIALMKIVLSGGDDDAKELALHTIGLLLSDEENALYMLERQYMVRYIDSVKDLLRYDSNLSEQQVDVVIFCLGSIKTLGKDKRYWKSLRDSGSTELINDSILAGGELFDFAIEVVETLSKDKKFVLSPKARQIVQKK